MTTKPAAHVLLVEDDPGDRLLTQKSLARSSLNLTLHTVEDGEQALAFLRGEGAFRDRPRPDLVLLDLNLPRLDGREVLRQIRRDPNLTHLPVVVLTTSQAESDVQQSYELHANCFITKPVDLERFREIMQSFEMFWFSIATLPKNSPSGVLR